MKKINLHLFILLAAVAISLSQEYRPFNPGRVYFYANEYIKGVKMDSIRNINGLNYYYFYKTWNDTGNCIMPNGPTWLGDYYTEDISGVYSFIKGQDTFRIYSNAKIDDEWTFYVSPDGDVLTARVESIDTEEFLGISDIVKTISITHYPVINEYFAADFKELKLSKNHGCLNVPSLYLGNGQNYEIIGMTNPDVGKTYLTRMDIYNFDIGDEFHGEASYRNSSEMKHGTSKTIRVVTEKTFSSNNDTIYYKFMDITERNITDETTNQEYRTIDSVISTMKVFLQNPISIYSEPEMRYLPGEAIILEPDHGIRSGDAIDYESVEYDKNTKLRKICSDAEWYELYDVDNNCWRQLHGDGITTVCYIEGCGLVSTHGYDVMDYVNFNLVYVKKANAIWGTPVIISSVDEQEMTPYDGIYPNPAKDFLFFIDLDLKHVDVITPQGIVVIENERTDRLDISSLQPGLYFVRSGNNIYRFIKIQ